MMMSAFFWSSLIASARNLTPKPTWRDSSRLTAVKPWTKPGNQPLSLSALIENPQTDRLNDDVADQGLAGGGCGFWLGGRFILCQRLFRQLIENGGRLEGERRRGPQRPQCKAEVSGRLKPFGPLLFQAALDDSGQLIRNQSL